MRFLVGLFLIFFALPGAAIAAPYCTVKKRCAYLTYDVSSATAIEQLDPNKKVHPASLTKLMTAYLLFDAISQGKLNLSDRVVVSAQAASMPALKMGWRAGQTVTLEDALEAVTIKSANDAAVVIAEAVSGTESAFARRMTIRAHEIGMNFTTFRNASGLPDPLQISTAKDMVTLARRVLTDYPRHRRYFSMTSARVTGTVIEGHNNLTKNGTIEGGKTGYIRESGFNMVAWSEEAGRLVISAIFGGRTAAARDAELSALLRKTEEKLRKMKLSSNAQTASATAISRRPAIKPKSVDDIIEASAPAMPAALPSGVEVSDIGDLIAANVPSTFSTSWAIQIGAYKNELQAQQALQAATRKVPDILGPAYPRALPTSTNMGQLYRAQIIGLDERQAKTACAALTNQGMQCLPLPPSG